MSSITVYTLPVCPNCDTFKDILNVNGIKYSTKDLEEDDVRMDLIIDCVTLVEAPIININGSYLSAYDAYKELGICV